MEDIFNLMKRAGIRAPKFYPPVRYDRVGVLKATRQQARAAARATAKQIDSQERKDLLESNKVKVTFLKQQQKEAEQERIAALKAKSQEPKYFKKTMGQQILER